MASQPPRIPASGNVASRSGPTSQKPRQLSHLHSQLAQLTAHISDLENLLKVTSVQAESMRGLGGYSGAMFMAASKVLGEETMNNPNQDDNSKSTP
ncbi:hypothetical protein BT63DRAFT_454923 [Microthyrium microscopicum]|uniref:DASH complex subunit Hsk3 like-domain-containing protein n=1 Tax=Microthyrium microscopicum TaxID=703497 RepID=A0A6A6UBH2_9PEZI|nr:hypothetical protein BT63DRAFT_454923 [Microthyrium microscopicum]